MTLWRDCPRMDWHKKRYGVCPDCYIRYAVPLVLDRERIARTAFDAFYAEGTPYSEIERAIFGQVADAVMALLTGEANADA